MLFVHRPQRSSIQLEHLLCPNFLKGTISVPIMVANFNINTDFEAANCFVLSSTITNANANLFDLLHQQAIDHFFQQLYKTICLTKS